MRITRQPAPRRQLLPEILQMPLLQPPLQKRPRIIPRRRVPLKINQIRRLPVIAAAEEMIVRHLIQRRARGIRRDVPAHVRVRVRPHHHRHRVPAQDALDLRLHPPVPRIRRLLFHRDRVDIRRRNRPRHRDPRLPQPLQQMLNLLPRHLRPPLLQQHLEHLRRRIQHLPVARLRDTGGVFHRRIRGPCRSVFRNSSHEFQRAQIPAPDHRPARRPAAKGGDC